MRIVNLSGMDMVEKILTLIDRKGMTQSALERAIGLSDGRITKWKNGVGEPTARNAREIARLMGVTVDYLVDDDQAEPVAAPRLTDAEMTALDLVRELGLEKGDVIRRLAGMPTTNGGGHRRVGDARIEEGVVPDRGGSVQPKRGGRAG